MKTRTIIFALLVCCPISAARAHKQRGPQSHEHGAAQSHERGAMQPGDGKFNPFVAVDPSGGFYLAYVERTNGTSNVMLSHSPDGATFGAAVRVNDRPGDATVRNENPPKVAVSEKA